MRAAGIIMSDGRARITSGVYDHGGEKTVKVPAV